MLTNQQRAALITALSESARYVLRTHGIVGGIRITRTATGTPEPLLSLDLDVICDEIARNGLQHVAMALDEDA